MQSYFIDHAWGTTTIADIKAYKPKNNSLTSGQVLMRDYSFEEGRLIIREMMDLMCLDLVDKDLVTGSVTIYVGYSNVLKAKPAKGTISFGTQTNANSIIIPAVVSLYERVVDRNKPIRRVNITCNKVVPTEAQSQQLSLFDNVGEDLERNYKIQKAVLDVKKKYGKNTIIKAMDLEEAATTIERNRQIGGHKSGE